MPFFSKEVIKPAHTLIFPFLCVIAAALFLCSCNNKKVWRIGVSQCSDDDWRTKMNEEIMREASTLDNVYIEIRSADDSSDRQIEDIRYFAENDFDIIIASPNEAAPLTPEISNVFQSGIPVIIFDRDIEGDDFTLFYGVDNRVIGAEAAKYASTLLNVPLKVIELEGLPGSSPAKFRKEGFDSVLHSDARNELLASHTASWKEPDAEIVADSMLCLFPQANIIYAHNDRMALGARKAADKLGRGDIKIIGIDAAPETGLKAVAEGKIDATFLYPTEGGRIVRMALDLLENRNGSKDIPQGKIVLNPITTPVDFRNAEILLAQNEQLKEEGEKIAQLSASVDAYWHQHSLQTSFLIAVIIIALLICGISFLILREYWRRKEYQTKLEERNNQLVYERDKQAELNKQLEEATQSKLMFFTNVSHDLRTPLTLIAEPLAQISKADNLTPAQHNLADIAVRNVRILQRLINDILDFRKYENKKMALALESVNIAELIGEWSSAFSELSRRRSIHLMLEIDESLKSHLLSLDAEKIERVYFNLLSNAFKYTPDNGTIVCNARLSGSVFTLKVSDTGSGISREDMVHIFDRFYQVDRVHPKGSGIGLSLSKAFVELHGGEISIESQVGAGTTFTVSIPVNIAETVSDTAHNSLRYSSNTSVVESYLAEVEDSPVNIDNEADDVAPILLVIDDNRDILAMISSELKQSFRVLTANNGKEGIQKANKYVPDIIICDVMMPEMDGMECCKRLKTEQTTSHIPVLMLTACSLDEQRIHGYASGADGYLAKPFSFEMLKIRLQSLLDNRKRIYQSHSFTPGFLRQEATLPAEDAGVIETKGLLGQQLASIDDDFYQRFLQQVEQNLSNSELSIDSLAANLGLGRSQFYRKIKALTNFSPVELLKNIRLHKARLLLTSTSQSISEIAYATGFSTPAYFTKCFRERFGETPTDLRLRVSGN